MLFKYGVSLQNNDQSSEAQEIYKFLQKYPSKMQRTALKLLNGMNKSGSLKPIRKLTVSSDYRTIQKRLARKLTLGNKTENALNMLGRKFTFGTMLRDLSDTVIGQGE